MNETLGRGNAVCQVCRQPKNRLRKRKSKLIPNMQMWVCDGCYVGKKEPRWAIILVARQEGGIPLVKDYIKHNRYVGDPIMLENII